MDKKNTHGGYRHGKRRTSVDVETASPKTSGNGVVQATVDLTLFNFTTANYRLPEYDIQFIYQYRHKSSYYQIKLGRYFAQNNIVFKTISIAEGPINKKLELIALFDSTASHTHIEKFPLTGKQPIASNRGVVEKALTALAIKIPGRDQQGIKVNCSVLRVNTGKPDDNIFIINKESVEPLLAKEDFSESEQKKNDGE